MQFKKRKKKTEINIVPLVDVLIVLIFFFLMTMQFRNLNVLNITPPKIDTAGKGDNAELLLVGIPKESELYFLGGVEVTEAALIEAFEAASEREEKPAVLILADEDTPLKRVTFIMDQSRKYKLDKVRLQAR